MDTELSVTTGLKDGGKRPKEVYGGWEEEESNNERWRNGKEKTAKEKRGRKGIR